MTIRFDDRVAIVTGAGNGLGREHALALAQRGARVVVNDLGGARDGTGASSDAAQAVVEEIIAAGGDAIADGADVTRMDQVESMVEAAMTRWGRIDILVNNAGILRDKTFAKGSLDDFRFVIEVHLMGSVNCTKAVWDIMREQNYGRVVMTTSSTGLYGNFGQSNYGAAKLAVVGFMNTLKHEGRKNDIRVNSLAPTAATRMTLDIMPEDMHGMIDPAYVTPGLLYLVSDDAPSGEILCAGAGCFAVSRLYETRGAFLGPDANVDDVAGNWDRITDTDGMKPFEAGMEQPAKWAELVAEAKRG